MCAASSAPCLARCNTVWRDTPRRRTASRIGTQSGGACSMSCGRHASVMRMRHGAPGVTRSPSMNPSLSHRWTVEDATPGISATRLTVTSSASAARVAGSRRWMFRWFRRLRTRVLSKRCPQAVVLPWRLRMPAMTSSEWNCARRRTRSIVPSSVRIVACRLRGRPRRVAGRFLGPGPRCAPRQRAGAAEPVPDARVPPVRLRERPGCCVPVPPQGRVRQGGSPARRPDSGVPRARHRSVPARQPGALLQGLPAGSPPAPWHGGLPVSQPGLSPPSGRHATSCLEITDSHHLLHLRVERGMVQQCVGRTSWTGRQAWPWLHGQQEWFAPRVVQRVACGRALLR